MTAAHLPSTPPADPRPQGTPAERRKLQVRDTIIKAAEDVFASEGAAGLSMRRLAERIDYSPAAIYKYFRSKDELLGAIREQFFERLLARVNASERTGDYDKARFCDALRAYVQTGMENPNHYHMAFVDLKNAEPIEGTLQYQATNDFKTMVSRLVENGTFRKVDLMLASHSIWASMHGLTNLMTSNPDMPHATGEDCDHLTRDELIGFHIEQIFRGLAREPDRAMG